MIRRALFVVLAACNSAVATDDAGSDGGFDATVDVAPEAGIDAKPAQCAVSIPKIDDAGMCHGVACAAQDPSFDRCVVVELHEVDGAAFQTVQCFDSDADTGQIVCCNAVNAGATVLVDATWTCCPGAAPDGGT